MLSSINTCLIIVYVTCLNSSVVEHLLFMQCYTVALQKRLVSAPVHAGNGLNCGTLLYKVPQECSLGDYHIVYITIKLFSNCIY